MWFPENSFGSHKNTCWGTQGVLVYANIKRNKFIHLSFVLDDQMASSKKWTLYDVNLQRNRGSYQQGHLRDLVQSHYLNPNIESKEYIGDCVC